MISPHNASVDYGDLLKAPSGYGVDFAIGTTYSLDLHALIGAHLSLGLAVDTDSTLAHDELYVFSALAEIKDRLLVFCEKGRIFGAKEYAPLFCMIEDSIVEVNLEHKGAGAIYPSFHPKTWIIRFTPANGVGPTRYRVCILSRNLTLDSSWDLAGSFEGDYREEHRFASPGGNDLKAYAQYLAKLYGDGVYGEKLSQVISEIPYVNLTSGSREYEMVPPLSFTGVPYWRSFDASFGEALDQASRVLVMSPFISASNGPHDPLARIDAAFEGRVDRPILITRRTTLAQSKTLHQKLQGFSIFAMRDDLVAAQFEDSEDDGSNSDPTAATIEARDIHAKLYVFEKSNRQCELFFGSANASARGFAVNCEAMAHLRIKRSGAFDFILGELGLTPQELEKGSLFNPISLEELISMPPLDETDISRQAQQREFDRFLRDITLTMQIEQPNQNENYYTVTVKMTTGDQAGDVAKRCTIALASEDVAVAAASIMKFENVQYRHLTRFVRITYRSDVLSSERIVNCSVTEGANYLSSRVSELFKRVTKNRFAEYLAFRLSDNPELTGGSARRQKALGSKGMAIGTQGLYEDLLKAYVRKPEQAEAFVNESLLMLESDSGEIDDDTVSLIKLLKTVREGARYAVK